MNSLNPRHKPQHARQNIPIIWAYMTIAFENNHPTTPSTFPCPILNSWSVKIWPVQEHLSSTAIPVHAMRSQELKRKKWWQNIKIETNYRSKANKIHLWSNKLTNSRIDKWNGFGLAFHWLKNWRDSFKPITKRSNRNHVITFDSHLKTALLSQWIVIYPMESTIQHINTTAER